jgi:hypothetical protein
MEFTDKIYAPIWGTHLGDCIMTLNYISNESEAIGKCVRLSDHYVKFNAARDIVKRRVCHNYYEIEKIIQNGKFHIVKDDPNHWCDRSEKSWHKYRHRPFLLNKHQFVKNNSRQIGYQFRARSRASVKNFPSVEIENLVLKSFVDAGFTPVMLGAPMTLDQCSQAMSKVEIFVGVMSGMAWIAATTRTPAIIVRNSMPSFAISHIMGYQSFIFCQDYVEVIDAINKYGQNRDYYDQNCHKIEKV